MEQIFGDRYEVEARLGSGGMAEVWRGHDRVLNRTVAIKTLHPQYARDTGFVGRFRREAQAAARLNHPGIVSVYDSGDGDNPYIVMQFIEGRTLADFLASGKHMAPMQAAQVAQGIAEALAAAHTHGVIHRDIKPANVMITRDGKVMVMDFGIARMISGPETAPQTSAVMGTASYLSPEQAQGQSVDARTDIYSLGSVLYEMLTGRPPFTGDSPMAIAYKQVNATPPPPSSLNPDVPAELDAVVMRSLSKNPANRYQTAQDFADDLERARTGQTVVATPLLPLGSDATQVISRPQPTSVLPPPEEERGGSRKAWLGALIALLVMALLAGGAYLVVTMLTDDSGTELVSMPNVVGKPFEEAQSILEDKGFTDIQTEKRVRDPALTKPGTVIEQDPAAQNQVDPSKTVLLTLAKAPPKVAVPPLEGLTVEQARTALEEVGLELGQESPGNSETIPEDHIISSTPAAGEKITKGSTVDVVVSTGPSLVTVPDVTCSTYRNAKTRLENLKLRIQLGDPVLPLVQCPNPVNVAQQDTPPNSSVDPGTVIVVHQGMLKPSPTPSPSP